MATTDTAVTLDITGMTCASCVRRVERALAKVPGVETAQTDETDRPEVDMRELTPPGGKWQVSVNRGRCAQWRADGREIFYVTPDFDFMAVPISYEHGLEIGTPTRLFNHRFTFSGGNTLFPYAVTNDGK